jgi:hypothetical protein
MRADAFCERAHEKFSHARAKNLSYFSLCVCHARARNPYFSDIFSMPMFAAD